LDSLPFGVEAFEYLADAVIVVDADLSVLYLNKAASKLIDTTQENVTGQKISDLIWDERLDSPGAKEHSGNTSSWSGKNRYTVKSNGKNFSAFASTSTFKDAYGGIRGTILLIKPVDKENSDDCSTEKSENVLVSDSEVGGQELANIIDAEALQSMMDDLYAVTKIGFAIIDLKGNVLASAGWQDICIKFHRTNPQTLWNCLESDIILTQGVARGQFKTYKCKNNMWDIVTPIIIGKRHVGNLFSGQFFFDDEVIDRDLFLKQAEKYGFEKDAYLATLDRVPRWNRAVVSNLMQFYAKLSEMISKLSYSNLKLSKALSGQKDIERELRQSHHDLDHAQDVAKTGSWLLNVQKNELRWSEETYRMFGIPKGTPLTYERFLKSVHTDDREFVDQRWKAALRHRVRRDF
jgi:PAS domain S-box-containing protein